MLMAIETLLEVSHVSIVHLLINPVIGEPDGEIIGKIQPRIGRRDGFTAQIKVNIQVEITVSIVSIFTVCKHLNGIFGARQSQRGHGNCRQQ